MDKQEIKNTLLKKRGETSEIKAYTRKKRKGWNVFIGGVFTENKFMSSWEDKLVI